jgi:hypothetical protein
LRLVLTIAVVAFGATAHADPCTGVTPSGGRFATCFDPGNRLSLTAGSDGIGLALGIRHEVTFEDDPDLVWKLEHTIAEATHGTWRNELTGVLYRGRYLRHARDGHIVLPLGSTPKKIFLPFDVGGFAEAGRVEWQPDSTAVRLGVVKTAALFDLARTRTFRRRFAFGPSARWDVDADRDAMTLTQHTVSPFTTAIANVHLESNNGLWVSDFAIEGGLTWESKNIGWKPDARAEATLERIIMAIDDRPIALTMGVRYDNATDETVARLGARVVLVDRKDSRVQLHPLVKR